MNTLIRPPSPGPTEPGFWSSVRFGLDQLPAAAVMLGALLCLLSQGAEAQGRHGGEFRGHSRPAAAYPGHHGGHGYGQNSGHVQGGYRSPAPAPFFRHVAPRAEVQYVQRPSHMIAQMPAQRVIPATPPVINHRAPGHVQSYGNHQGYGNHRGYGTNQGYNQTPAFGTAFGAPYGTGQGRGYAEPRGHNYGTAPSYVRPYVRPYIADVPRLGPPRWHFPNGYGLHRGYPSPGLSFPSLGPGHLALGFGGARWFFDRGVWYRPGSAGYIVAVPPYGLMTPVLPPTYASIDYAGVPYYYDNGVYYTEQPGQGYLVTPPPSGLPPIAANADGSAVVSSSLSTFNELQVSGLSNQSSVQYFSDRADCSRWASEQSGFDPVRNPPNDEQTVQRAQSYRNAEMNCLRARSYEVR